MNALLLFPTLVTQEDYPEKDKFKDLILKNIHKHLSPEGYSHERTGHVTLHHEKAYQDFFQFVTSCVKQHFEVLGIDSEIYEYNVVKTWFNLTKEMNNPRHNHSDAHVSFSYYVNTPEEIKKMICFFVDKPPNSFYTGMLNNVHTHNIVSSESWSLETNEGQLFIFPSNLAHAVIKSKDDIQEGSIANTGVEAPIKNAKEASTYRIVIAGDIVLTHKNKAAVSLGLQPVGNWKTFNTKPNKR